MTTTTVGATPLPSSAIKRISIVMSAVLLPFLLAIVLSSLFNSLGNYTIVAITAAKTEFASITYPKHNATVTPSFTATGTIDKLPANTTAYLMAKRDDRYWPKKHIGNKTGKWSHPMKEGSRNGSKLYLVVLALSPSDKATVDQWHATSEETGEYPGITQFSTEQEIAAIEVKQK